MHTHVNLFEGADERQCRQAGGMAEPAPVPAGNRHSSGRAALVSFPAADSVCCYSLTAPAVAFMIRFWKMKKTMATGMVMIAAAASFSGYCVPALS